MILIISTQIKEMSTAEVIDWLDYKQASYLRINGEELQAAGMTFEINNSSPRLRLGGKQISVDEIQVVWLRRSGYNELPELEEGHPLKLSDDIRKHARTELRTLKKGAWMLLKDKTWLTRPDQNHINKLYALQQAAQSGLLIPESLVTTDRQALLKFKQRHSRIIIKALDAFFSYFDQNSWMVQYTHEVEEEFIEQLPKTFFPCLLQQYIEKQYELRVFYFNGQCYPMAIFSQKNQKTALDFRHYDKARPNRTVPYRLPESLEKKIHAFMQAVDLQTGSLDLIRSKEGDYVFLEVNPVGQFGMVSKPCNYHLEEKVAEWLIDNSVKY